ncbi:MAG: AMP-binding protein [Promethearchaeota archaeon]
MKTAKGRISKKKSGNRRYDSVWVYIPSKISKDSSFPFKNKEEVIIELKGGTLIVRKIFRLSEITGRYGVEDATLPQLMEKKALINRDLPFIYFQNDSFSYQEANKISNRIANGLLKLIKELKLKMPKIALLFPNCPESIFYWFGVVKAGCVFVAISYLLKSDLLEFVLKNSDTEILIIDYKYFDNFEEISINLQNIKKIFIRNAPKGFSFNEKLADIQEIFSDDFKNPKINIENYHPLEILYTSGTTGKPKGVLYRNHNILSGISIGRQLEEVDFNKVPHKIYCPIPLFQGFPRYLMVIPALFYNASIIITEKFDISKFWDDIHYYKPDGFCYYGAYLLEMVNQEPKDTDRKHSVKYAFGFGAYKEIWETFERRFGIDILEGWSLVEGIGITINTTGSKGGKIGSVGKPVRGFEIKIVDSNGKELRSGRNNVGEIISRSKPPFELEYYNLEEETNTKLGKDRWVHTGDFGYKDKEGFIYFLGRKTDMIHRGRERFFAIDIELVANSHPLIIESAVFEVPINGFFDSSDRALKISAVIKKGASLTYKEFHYYLKENLAYFMVPRYIEFKKELPKNANELIQKFILKKEWENENAKRNTYDTQTGKLRI